MSLLTISDAKRAANRANARKSTGPVTSEGKSRSSQNAARHGIFAKAHAIPHLGEDQIEFDAFLDLYFDRFRPRNPEETFQLEIMFEQHVAARRLARWTAAAVQLLAEQVATSENEDERAGETHLAAIKNGDVLEKSIRLQAKISATYAKARREFEHLRHNGDFFGNPEFQWPDPDELIANAAARRAQREQNEPTTPAESTPPQSEPPRHTPNPATDPPREPAA